MPRMTICRSSLATVFVLGLAAAAPAQGARPASYTVKPGDTLWEIARVQLGDPHRWSELQKLNAAAVPDPRRLTPGTVLSLGAPSPAPAPAPAAAQPAPAIAQPAAAMASQDPQGPGDGMELFRRRRVANVQNAFAAYREVKFHPLRAGQFHSAGFLTDNEAFPFGTILGPVTPEQIQSARSRAAVQRFTSVGIAPPAGASYAAGDTLLVVELREGPVGYGQIAVPTGMVRITGQNGAQAVGDVVAVYAPIRDGQSVMPAEKFSDPGAVEYRPVPNGIEGHVLAPRDARELRQPQEVLFLDIGRDKGVAMGDLFEVRRTPGPQTRSLADAREEVMATVQVVHVGARTATARVLKVMAPEIHRGARVVLVAKLPG